jgi:APA family basic amino acid/polyamine antiporter
MGGIVGSGIFMNPSVVARYVPSAGGILLAWVAGGAIALLGGGLFAELASRRPRDGGLYAYMCDAFHPSVGFLYGWTLLLVSQSGGMAAAAVTFANYFEPLTGLHVSAKALGVLAIASFTAINALGVRSGAGTQNVFMAVKIAAIAGFVFVGIVAPRAASVALGPAAAAGTSAAAIGLAMVPVLFAYSGWQTASFMSAELKTPERTLPRGLILGVSCVVILYLAVNAVCVRVLGPAGLAATRTPASAIAQVAFGPIGGRIMAAVVAVSTLGFLSNQILTSPRVYFQMAADGTFFRGLAWIDPRTHVPSFAILAQGAVAAIVALSGRYDQILNYVTSVDYVFFGLAGVALIVFRRRDTAESGTRPHIRLPGYPWTAIAFVAISWAVVGDVVFKSPGDTSIGLGIMLAGLPVYAIFRAVNRRREATPS